MSAVIDLSNYRENMAYVGQKPWHGLGQELKPGMPLEVWRREAGLEFEYRTSPILFDVGHPVGELEQFDDKFVIYRSDTKAPMAVVSNRYHPVQPKEIIEFFRELIDIHGFEMETAGSLKGGSVIWALAKTGLDFSFGRDTCHQYALLMTSCDTKLATRATLTAVRVVCWNTLSAALNRAETDLVVVRHSQQFNQRMVKQNLGFVESTWDQFADASKAMTKTRLKDVDVKTAIIRIFGDPERDADDQPQQRAMAKVLELFNGKAKGANLPSADGTAWGLLNAVTEYVDHHTVERQSGGRLASAWTGVGKRIKDKALDACVEMAA